MQPITIITLPRGGHKSPILLKKILGTQNFYLLIKKETIEEILSQALSDESVVPNVKSKGIFLVEVNVPTNNCISVFLDSDAGVKIEDCVLISRFLEQNLDREEEDFELQVSSAGLDMPLKLHRQYIKNIGKKIEVVFVNGQKKKYDLINVYENEIEVSETKKVKLESSKRKKMITEINKLPFADIKTTKVIPDFLK